jgi:excisionase family DNA binding protein
VAIAKQIKCDPEFLRVKHAAELMGCSDWTIWKKLTAGELQRYKFGSLTMVKRSELLELVHEAE